MPVLTHGASGRFGGTQKDRTALESYIQSRRKSYGWLGETIRRMWADYVIEKMTEATKVKNLSSLFTMNYCPLAFNPDTAGPLWILKPP